MLFLQTALPLLSASIVGLIKIAHANTVIHDDSFIPDAILSVTKEQRKQSCVSLKDILLVNGTSPGPELRFKEGETVWIRVYNNIPNQNLTMVIIIPTLCLHPLPPHSFLLLLQSFIFKLRDLKMIEIGNYIAIFILIF
jgi:FtsP/CotA-like multicopper oxidase with cupredoxin domain